MLGQYNWLLHSCTQRAQRQSGGAHGRCLCQLHILHPPQLTAIATATLPPSSLEMCCHYCAPLFSLSAISMEIFDPRKLLRCHSSLVEQARCARGRRCWRRWRWRCTKIWRNYTTRPLASLIPHHPRALTLFQPLSHFSQPSHSSFCPLFFREENTSDKTKYEFTKSYLEYIQDRTFYKLDQFGVGRYGHQCRQGDKDALTKASKCRNLERSD